MGLNACGSTAMLTNSTISGNAGTTVAGEGLSGSTVTIMNSTSVVIRRTMAGGIRRCVPSVGDNSTVMLTNSTVSGNTADGGGILMHLAARWCSEQHDQRQYADNGGGVFSAHLAVTASADRHGGAQPQSSLRQPRLYWRRSFS